MHYFTWKPESVPNILWMIVAYCFSSKEKNLGFQVVQILVNMTLRYDHTNYNKYMIASTKIANSEVFAFIAVLVLK